MFDHVEAFYRPSTIPEALRFLAKGHGRGRFVAGGTHVVVQADRSIRFLVDITRLGLDYVRQGSRACVVGATTTMAGIENSPAMLALANGILATAASTSGSVQERNMATVGGDLANASPAADIATPLLALDAVVVVADARGRRKIPLADFFSGPHRTVLGRALLVEIVVPAPPRGGRVGWSFQKLGRTESDISVVNVAAGLQVDLRGCCRWTRIALGAVGPTPLRARTAESRLVGQRFDRDVLERVCDAVAREVRPITDLRASAEYRRQMSLVLTRRALEECAARGGCPL
ncbi:MAG TPA: xanthine dehydrogenase family protein subunit M [Terriglobia bacterium]|nr:xanthine dehydrogenase family protein subunit M [Terriglobia bacterium]